jgi:type IV secretion system protein VirD4
MKRSLLITVFLSLAAFWLAGMTTEAVMEAGPSVLTNPWQIYSRLPGLVEEGHILPGNPIALAVGFAAACLVWVAWAKYNERAGMYRRGEEHGSSRWATKEEMRLFSDRKDRDNNIILTKNASLRLIDDHSDRMHERNNNVLVVGGSGSGKTRGYALPNFMQLNANFVATDPKGTLIDQVGDLLVSDGYELRTFSTVDFSKSFHYNPLAYAYDEQKILSIVSNIIENTTGDPDHSGDPFWENAEKLLYTALIAYLIYHCPPRDRNIPGLLTLLSLAEAREEDESYMSPLDLLFNELETGMRYVKRSEGGKRAFDAEDRSFDTGDASFAWVRTGEPVPIYSDFALQSYHEFKVAAGKTMKSILISCNVRMKPFTIPAVRELLEYDEMHLDRLGDTGHKAAIIASVSDTDSTYDFLFALLMWQAMDVLCDVALERYRGSLPRPVHFLLDEFANIGKIPDFERKIAVIRSRNISASLIMQSISQLADNYGDNAAETIVDCCDTMLFLGGKSEKTTKAISESAGKQTIAGVSINDSRGSHYSTTHNFNVLERDLIQASEVGRLPADEAIVLISGAFPFKDKKYDPDDHPRRAMATGPFDLEAYREHVGEKEVGEGR